MGRMDTAQQRQTSARTVESEDIFSVKRFAVVSEHNLIYRLYATRFLRPFQLFDNNASTYKVPVMRLKCILFYCLHKCVMIIMQKWKLYRYPSKLPIKLVSSQDIYVQHKVHVRNMINKPVTYKGPIRLKARDFQPKSSVPFRIRPASALWNTLQMRPKSVTLPQHIFLYLYRFVMV